MQYSQDTSELEDRSTKDSQTEIRREKELGVGGKKKERKDTEAEYPKTVGQSQRGNICSIDIPGKETENCAEETFE